MGSCLAASSRRPALGFFAGARFCGFGRCRHLSSAGGGPAGHVHLASAREAQRVGGHVFGDDRAPADVRAVSPPYGGNPPLISADEDAPSDRGWILVYSLLNATDGARAHVPS